VPSFTPDETTFTPQNYLSGEITEFNPSEDLQDADNNKYKKELCKNWLEKGSCRYGKLCQFAHGK